LAIASPIPEVEPVTTADFPLSMADILWVRGARGGPRRIAALQYKSAGRRLRALSKYRQLLAAAL
jgi:hypothetical protein